MAHDAGIDATCARDRGLLGTNDRLLVHRVVADDYTLLTCNSKDFQGHGTASPGGLYALQELHAGLICLNSHAMMTYERQRLLFERALSHFLARPDLFKQPG